MEHDSKLAVAGRLLRRVLARKKQVVPIARLRKRKRRVRHHVEGLALHLSG